NFKLFSLSGTNYEGSSGHETSGSVWGDDVFAPDSDVQPVTIHLFKDGVDTGLTAVTDTNGYYHFDNLGPGSYTVSEDVPDGWTEDRKSVVKGDRANRGDPAGNDVANCKVFALSGHK